MSALKRFFRDSIIYGFATVLPRLMNFVLVPLHTETLGTRSYSVNTAFYVWAAFFNVILTYGMETSFFRFFSSEKGKKKVFSTAFISLLTTTAIFLALALLFEEYLLYVVGLQSFYFRILLGILILDTVVVIPFAYLRATGRSVWYAVVKTTNILLVVFLNFLFLSIIPRAGSSDYLPQILYDIYNADNKVQYIFIANIIASAFTFLVLLPWLFRVPLHFDFSVLKRLLAYGWPVMVAGIAFVINENLDKLLIREYLSEEVMGAYAACYKLAVFMTIYIQAFRIGAEPFFFSHSRSTHATQAYAFILKWFVIAGGLMFVGVVVYIDLLKTLFIRDITYQYAIVIVPVVLLANLCLGIYHNLSIWYKLTDRTHYGMYLSIGGALITIAVNIVLLPIVGFMASAWATLAAYASMMVVSYMLGKKKYPVPYDLSKILSYLSLAICLVAVSCIFFRGSYDVGTLLIAVYILFICICERSDLMMFFKSKTKN